jgi:iron complex transport system substrate-binding protein
MQRVSRWITLVLLATMLIACGGQQAAVPTPTNALQAPTSAPTIAPTAAPTAEPTAAPTVATLEAPTANLTSRSPPAAENPLLHYTEYSFLNTAFSDTAFSGLDFVEVL